VAVAESPADVAFKFNPKDYTKAKADSDLGINKQDVKAINAARETLPDYED
jgi:hypothetical protein